MRLNPMKTAPRDGTWILVYPKLAPRTYMDSTIRRRLPFCAKWLKRGFGKDIGPAWMGRHHELVGTDRNFLGWRKI